MDIFTQQISNPWTLLPILIWTAFWKGFALWTAVKKDHKKWFVALIILNTFGVLEIIYLFWIAKKNLGDVKKVLARIFLPSKKE
ncbi:MAG: DUF5652 family protein [Candidatus Paceibacterota bacterium]|jgi:hypothetical protein